MTTSVIKEVVEFEDTFLQNKIERRVYEQREKSDKRLLFLYEFI
jgi:hypothetical protein